MTRVLGIEGTAWCASAAVFDSETDSVSIESNAYVPESGGIHPREAAEHMRSAIPAVVEDALDHVREEYGAPADALDAIAFSRGPGIGPCLRIAGTAARALAGALEIPLVGANHMVAHLEIGRHRSGFDSPVCLNASGANAHILGFRNGRYRVLGETMDTGVGNAIDKFTRHVGWQHPGGPKVEEHAREGDYIDLPYVVKGMDFSFSGIMSAAKQAYDGGTPVEDVCCGLQETIFAMLTEVSERALSLTGADELVLGGGVGQNDRLRAMLESMCEERGADFYAPEPRFLRDNAGMIAVLGAKMYEAGDTVPIDESRVLPDFRPDEVDVTWRSGEAVAKPVPADERAQGAEAIVDLNPDDERVHKHRLAKAYRHPELDAKLRQLRTRSEARLTSEARRLGVPTPVVYDIDPVEATLDFEFVGESDLREVLTEPHVADVGRHLALCHEAGFVHGDPTPRNVRVASGEADGGRAYLIDFGLGYYTDDIEDYAMDLHVFEGSVGGTADDAPALIDAFEAAYRETGDERVVEQLREIEERGRYQ
ncbi:bifunctional N(6)-L-threonylcarbamoyladenine synthase/serine/threonine protein kinase [Natronomonas halophila]|uniref:bifunctional N(6)-L-threonylcarbamoyladenine synthase/serine/threonine protein kinase n=1 Tax=Natronomonas halophila TaxID=2747817 RepID=UPI0015B68379|nr:bifunctional N(6)-L-threonylcarbamoyladenine synthase/serine/threonine protein kinase [Natronomonas halophila]QLD85248.1 bifunctional N(6)-L-threonylcarbamoyladenine synthase/serine/threonine protein kinase [Natronomonas halophila]